MLEKKYEDIVVSSRIRLARNIKDYVFPNKIYDGAVANEIISKVFDTFPKFENYKVQELDKNVLYSLKEKHLISDELVKNKHFGALSLSTDEQVSIMINEEEHIREQCILKGFSLETALQTISEIDTKLSKNIDFCYDEKLGYITTCPSNLGTGMRASCMLFLPALAMTNSLENLFNSLNSVGITVRGNYGENSDFNGFLFQVSNSQTLGLSEEQIIQNVSTAVLKICEKEQQARELILENKYDELVDLVGRAYGVLKFCHSISSSEAIKLLSQVKLGICLNILFYDRIEEIDSLIEDVKPYTLNTIAGKNMDDFERDMFRAEYIKQKI